MPFLRYFFLSVLLIGLLVVGWAGFRGETSTKPPIMVFPDMDDQAKIKYQAQSDFFADGKGGRQPVASTIPMGLSIANAPAAETDKHASLGFTSGNDYYHTGRVGDYWGDGIPQQIELNEALIRRGSERFGIYCAPCHGLAGDGAGITSKYGVPVATASFYQAAFADPKDPNYKTDGNIFNTITYGKGQMGPYGAMVPVNDRWAIVAYVRTLQLAKKETSAPAAAPAAPAAQPAEKK